MRRVWLALLPLMLLIPVERAEAAPIFFDFTLEFVSGDHAGQSFEGTLSVESADQWDRFPSTM